MSTIPQLIPDPDFSSKGGFSAGTACLPASVAEDRALMICTEQRKHWPVNAPRSAAGHTMRSDKITPHGTNLRLGLPACARARAARAACVALRYSVILSARG